jgi:hypothetical protein
VTVVIIIVVVTDWIDRISRPQDQIAVGMAMRCLRVRSPILQFLRYASSTTDTNAIRSSTTSRQGVIGSNVNGGQSLGFAARPKATYEPSPIFGAVKPTQKEALKKSTPEIQKSKTTRKLKVADAKGPISEDDKIVCFPHFIQF